MGVPNLSLPTKVIALPGEREVTVRALSHGEALEVAEIMGEKDLDTMAPAEQRRFQAFVLAAAFDATEEEVARLIDEQITTADVQVIVQGVIDASGLGADEKDPARPTETPSPGE